MSFVAKYVLFLVMLLAIDCPVHAAAKATEPPRHTSDGQLIQHQSATEFIGPQDDVDPLQLLLLVDDNEDDDDEYTSARKKIVASLPLFSLNNTFSISSSCTNYPRYNKVYYYSSAYKYILQGALRV